MKEKNLLEVIYYVDVIYTFFSEKLRSLNTKISFVN